MVRALFYNGEDLCSILTYYILRILNLDSLHQDFLVPPMFKNVFGVIKAFLK